MAIVVAVKGVGGGGNDASSPSSFEKSYSQGKRSGGDVVREKRERGRRLVAVMLSFYLLSTRGDLLHPLT